MMTEDEWEKKVSLHIKSEMTKRALDVPKLTELFLAHGYKCTRDSIRGKVDRGKFSFIFYLQFMHVIGAKNFTAVCLGNPEEIDISLK